MNGLELYLWARRQCKQCGLSTNGRTIVLQERLKEAGHNPLPSYPEEDGEVTPEPCPFAKFAHIAAEVEAGIGEAEAVIATANAELVVVARGQQALEQLFAPMKVLTELGLFQGLAPDAAEQLVERGQRAQKKLNEGQSGLSQFGSLGDTYNALRNVLELLGMFGYEEAKAAFAALPALTVELPEPPVSTTAQPSRWHFVVSGNYQADAIVEGTTLNEAKANLKAGKIVGGNWTPYNSWCHEGQRRLWTGVERVTQDQPQRSSEYGARLTVRTSESIVTSSLHRYTFTLSGSDYEGYSVVTATSVATAIQMLLAGQVIEGDKLSDAEFETEEWPVFLAALGKLSESNPRVTSHGHTLLVSWS